MSRVTSLGGSSSAVNVNSGGFEPIGFGGTIVGGGKTVTSGAIAVKGSWTKLDGLGASGVLLNDIAGFSLHSGFVGSASTRMLIDLWWGTTTPDGATTPKIGNIFSAPGTTGLRTIPLIPMNIPAGNSLWARTSSSGNAAGIQIYAKGRIRTATCPPLYDNCEEIVATALTNTVPNTVDVLAVAVANTGWTEFKASTGREYKAIVTNTALRTSAAVPGSAAQVSTLRVGLAPAILADAVLMSASAQVIASAASGFGGELAQIIDKTVPASSRLAVEMLQTTVISTDVTSVEMWGFW